MDNNNENKIDYILKGIFAYFFTVNIPAVVAIALAYAIKSFFIGWSGLQLFSSKRITGFEAFCQTLIVVLILVGIYDVIMNVIAGVLYFVCNIFCKNRLNEYKIKEYFENKKFCIIWWVTIIIAVLVGIFIIK